MSLDKGVAPDRNLESTVLDVSRGDDRVLVEIDAGSRDGVKEGWVLTIGDEGTFIGKLRIIDVDINRSTGILSLENSERGSVRIGHRAYALMGQD
jgi:cell shape-determining protein MreC